MGAPSARSEYYSADRGPAPPFFVPMSTAMETYRASTFKLEDSPATWQATLARLPNAHPLQSWAWGQFKSRWGWEAMPLTMSVGGNSWETIAAAMVL